MFEGGRSLAGYHGAWSETDRHIPLILSGAGIREGAELGACELVDIAATLSTLLGGAIPENNQGRILWEALDMAAPAPNVDGYLDLLSQRDNALEELKQLKRERAGGAIYRSEYEENRAEILMRARVNLAAMEEERKRLEIRDWDRGME